VRTRILAATIVFAACANASLVVTDNFFIKRYNYYTGDFYNTFHPTENNPKGVTASSTNVYVAMEDFPYPESFDLTGGNHQVVTPLVYSQDSTGAAIGPDGNLYIGYGNGVIAYNPATGVPTTDAADGFFFANTNVPVTDIAWGGNLLYVSEGIFGEVYNLAGQKVNGWTGNFPPFLHMQGLAFHDGALYATDLQVSGARILRFGDLSNLNNYTVLSNDSHLNQPYGLAFGPNGMLYVANMGSHSVLRFDGTTGAFVDTFITGLQFPQFLTFTETADPTPEPGSYLLMGCGLLVLARVGRRLRAPR